jgi:methanogenic corrinoid protein MtbC1
MGMSREGIGLNFPRLEGHQTITDSESTAPQQTNHHRHNHGPHRHLSSLELIVEAEIIPRLMLAHSDSRIKGATPAQKPKLDRSNVLHFAGLVLADDPVKTAQYIAAMRSSGIPLDSIYAELLAPTACRLGELWEDDLCDYSLVALGMWRLQQVLYDLHSDFEKQTEAQTRGWKALLVSAPAEQHMLAFFMVSEFFRNMTSDYFRRAGWDVWGAPTGARDDLLEIARSEWFDVIEVSASCAGRIAALAEDIRAIRRVSLNKSVGVLVGGPAFTAHPELVEICGADLSSADERQVVAQAEHLIGTRSLSGARRRNFVGHG